MGVLRAFRNTFRRDFDLNGFTDRGPLVVRDYSVGFDHNFRQVVGACWKPITDEEYLKLKKALEKAGHPFHSNLLAGSTEMIWESKIGSSVGLPQL